MKPLAKSIPIHKYLIQRFWLKLFNSTPNHDSFDKIRNWILRRIGFKVAKNVKVFKPIRLSPKTLPSNIAIAQGSFINSGARFSAPSAARISIGEECLIGPNVIFETVNHGLNYVPGRNRGAIISDIRIHDGVWIGGGSILLQNIEVGSGSVIAAGAVVTKSVPQNVVVGGVPAKEIKPIQ